jgi:hypothetical protein
MKTHSLLSLKVAGLVLVGFALCPALSQAALVFTDKTDFLNNRIAPGSYLENFEGLTAGGQGGNLARSSGGFSYTVSAPTSVYVVSDLTAPPLPSGQAITTFFNGNNLVITFTSGNVTAVGGDFFLTNLEENWVAGTFTVGLNDGTTSNVDLLTGPPAANTVAFRGFTSDSPITSLTISGFNAPGTQFGTLDNFYVGVNAVPEAPTWIGVGLIALVITGRAAMAGLNVRKSRRSIGRVET